MKCSETTLDTGESFMTVRHLVIKGTNYEIGKTLGDIAVNRHNFCKEVALSDPVMTRARRCYFAQNYPIHLERARGVADALNVDSMDDTVDVTEIPLTQMLLGCSVVYYPPQTTVTGTGCLSCNYDFPTATLPDIAGITDIPPEIRQTLRPLMADPYIIELYPETGYASLCLTGFELLSGVLDGVNAEGLMVSVMGDETVAVDPSLMVSEIKRVGLHELQGMRLLLDTCATTKQAKQALLTNKHFHTFMPCHYIVADRTSSFVYEYSCGHNNEYIVEGTGIQIVTNHPLHQYASVNNFPEDIATITVGTSSFERYKTMVTMIENEPPPYTGDFIKSVNNAVSVSNVISQIPEKYREQIVASPALSRTLWHCMYDSDALTLDIKFLTGDECGDDFVEYYTEYFHFALEQ